MPPVIKYPLVGERSVARTTWLHFRLAISFRSSFSVAIRQSVAACVLITW
jgi:hypothetical protein